MEGGEVTPTTSPSSLTKLCEDSCPFFMSIGMTLDEFWNGDCEATLYHLRAHRIRQDRLNSEMYWQGYYTFFAAHRAILKAFSKNESEAEQVNYLDQPLPRTEEEVEEMKRQEDLKRHEQMKAHFMHKSTK